MTSFAPTLPVVFVFVVVVIFVGRRSERHFTHNRCEQKRRDFCRSPFLPVLRSRKRKTTTTTQIILSKTQNSREEEKRKKKKKKKKRRATQREGGSAPFSSSSSSRVVVVVVVVVVVLKRRARARIKIRIDFDLVPQKEESLFDAR